MIDFESTKILKLANSKPTINKVDVATLFSGDEDYSINKLRDISNPNAGYLEELTFFGGAKDEWGNPCRSRTGDYRITIKGKAHLEQIEIGEKEAKSDKRRQIFAEIRA